MALRAATAVGIAGLWARAAWRKSPLAPLATATAMAILLTLLPEILLASGGAVCARVCGRALCLVLCGWMRQLLVSAAMDRTPLAPLAVLAGH